ncbi:MFS transporter [Peptococcaceae bacterium 1198_IL3148]
MYSQPSCIYEYAHAVTHAALYVVDISGDKGNVGLVMASFTIGALIMRVIAGWLVDNYGRKKIMLWGMVAAVVVVSFYRLATNIPLMLLVRALHGMAFGMISTAASTMVADILPTARMGEGMGYFGLTTALAMALAPMTGVWLVETSSYTTMFITISVLAVVALFCGLPVRGTNGVVANAAPDTIGEVLAGLLEKKAALPSVVMCSLAILNGAIIPFVALYAVERGVANVGLFFTANAVLTLLSRPIAGRMTDRGRTDLVLLIGHLSLFVCVVVLGLANTLTEFIIAGAFFGWGFGFVMPTLQALAVRYVAPHRRGAATGTFFIAFDLGLGVGNIFFGFLAEALSYQIMFFITLIPLIIAAVIYYLYRPRPSVENC